MEWFKQGDPEDIPIVFSSGTTLAASCLGRDVRDVTWKDACNAAVATGTHNAAFVHGFYLSPYTRMIAGLVDDIKVQEERSTNADNARMLTRCYFTPAGTLRVQPEIRLEVIREQYK